MKVLFASSPVIGHFNPMLSAARIMQRSGHETAFYTGSLFREKAEAIGAPFFPLPVGGDYDLRSIDSDYPERKKYAPGPEQLLFDLKTFFVDKMVPQFRGLEAVLREFRADLVVHETALLGILPLLLAPRGSRPATACLSVTTTTLPREDGAPFGPGFPPPTNDAQRAECEAVSQNIDAALTNPVKEYTNKMLAGIGVRQLSMSVFEAVATLADVILQPCVPSFEFPVRVPQGKLHFIGALLPAGSGDLPSEVKEAKEAGRKIVLVTQGTLANGDLGQLVGKVIQAVGDREDILIVVTTGGRPVDSVPCPLTPNTVVSEFLNFREVLPHVDVMVAFGGYGTVTQALSFGVPMILSGLTEDKPEIAARVVWSGSGTYLRTDEPTVEQVRAAIEEVLNNPSYHARAKELSLEFAAYDADRRLAEVLEAVGAGHEALVG